MIILSNIEQLYDGSGASEDAVHRGVDLCIEDGRIKDLRPHDSSVTRDQLTVIDCSGKTVTPGIIDCHGHVTIWGLSRDDFQRMASPSSLVYVEKILYKTLVEGGVTTVRDVGGATDAIKRLVDQGVIIGPRLKISICMLSSTGGHADFRGPDRCHADLPSLFAPGPGRPSSLVDGVEDCRLRVREIAACGADLIKICTSPGVASPTDHLEHRDLAPDEIEMICKEAEARGLRVAAHAHSASGIELAIRHGVHDIQHMSFMDERLVEMAAAADCTVTPTSWVVEQCTRSGLDPFVLEKAKRVAEVHHRAVHHAHTGGLRILHGSDPVLPGMHGKNFNELVQLIVDGLSPLEAWHGATGLAAQEIGQTDTGILAAGRWADLLICEGDVIQQPSLLGQGALTEVVKEGVGYRGGIEALPQRRYEDTLATLWPDMNA